MQGAVEQTLDAELSYEMVDGKPVPKDTPFTCGTGLDPERHYEFVDGQLVENEMPPVRHSGVCTRLARKLGNVVEANALGEVYQEASFEIGVRERLHDLAFISAERLPDGITT